ncbi:hypothetical protein Glove_22g45 [Diversispora epigaea]|uniref:Uncharacterized protein n=1 Tax=Diversispora epigaea TaxID=1348612 RepID=A0A397JVP9_9GLOM|nr:hypothetical protein Glove_22g45 [Diversispora epigaea]
MSAKAFNLYFKSTPASEWSYMGFLKAMKSYCLLIFTYLLSYSLNRGVALKGCCPSLKDTFEKKSQLEALDVLCVSRSQKAGEYINKVKLRLSNQGTYKRTYEEDEEELSLTLPKNPLKSFTPITFEYLQHKRNIYEGTYKRTYEEDEEELSLTLPKNPLKSFTPITFEYLQHKRNIYEGYWYRKPLFLLIKRNTPEINISGDDDETDTSPFEVDLTKFKDTYLELDPDCMWTLKSGRKVEKIIYEFARNFSEKTFLHSFIINDADTNAKSLFSDEEWKEITSSEVKNFPNLDCSLIELIKTYMVDNINELQKVIYEPFIDKYDNDLYFDHNFINFAF